MTSTIDLLFLRHPKIDYISPPVCEVLFSSSSGPVIVLNPLTPQSFPTGLILGGAGSFFLNWNTYPGALCYSVYQSVNPDDAFGEYRIVAECIPNPPFDLSSFGPGFFRVSAITLDGETPLSLPIHFDGGGGAFECPFFTGPIVINPVNSEIGDNVILGPKPVNEGFGGGVVSYEWRKNGLPYLDTTHTTKNSLEIDNVQPSDAGQYSLQVSNEIDACDFIVSEDISLTINIPQPQEWWKMDETGSNTTRIGTIAGTPLVVFPALTVPDSPGLLGNAAHFFNDGTRLHEDLKTSTDFVALQNLQTGFTMTGWLNFISKSVPVPLVDIEYSVTLSGFKKATLGLVWQNNQITLTLRDDTNAIRATVVYPANFNLGEWYFYRAFYNATDHSIGIQVNGASVGVLMTAASTYIIPVTTGGRYFITGDTTTVNPLDPQNSVLVDENGIFPFVLSEAQGIFLWNNRLGRTYPF